MYFCHVDTFVVDAIVIYEQYTVQEFNNKYKVDWFTASSRALMGIYRVTGSEWDPNSGTHLDWKSEIRPCHEDIISWSRKYIHIFIICNH